MARALRHGHDRVPGRRHPGDRDTPGLRLEIIDDSATGFLRGGIGELAAALNEAGPWTATDAGVAATRFSAKRMVSEHLRLYEEALTGVPAPSDARAPLDASSLV
ncbi:hypothetical protein GCM10009712_37540 [Pseudarthrobacter sulfonivorans]|nr:hypothetical protein [Pseudarthrobacter sulfonivorans]